MQAAYNPVIPLICTYKPGTEEPIKYTLKRTDDQGVNTIYGDFSPTIVNSEAKEEAFLHFLYKFSRTRELMQWIDKATLLSKFQLHLQGCYQTDWNNILEADANYFEEQVQNFLFDIFAEN
jgi:hypothetical protein